MVASWLARWGMSRLLLKFVQQALLVEQATTALACCFKVAS